MAKRWMIGMRRGGCGAQTMRDTRCVALVLIPGLGGVTDTYWIPRRHKDAPKLAFPGFMPPAKPLLGA